MNSGSHINLRYENADQDERLVISFYVTEADYERLKALAAEGVSVSVIEMVKEQVEKLVERLGKSPGEGRS